MAAGLGKNLDETAVSSFSLITGGAVTGTIAGALIANNLVPSYIPDNRGLFVIGGMWIGAAEGALAGMVVRQAIATPTPNMDPMHPEYATVPAYIHSDLGSQLQGALIGSIPGLLMGTGAGALLIDQAPTYGRVALIQSAAAVGAVFGSLSAVGLRWNPFHFKEVEDRDKDGKLVAPYLQDARSNLNLALPALIGLNVGLGAGLIGAYLPDQSRYGPSWERIMLIDLATGAGALAGGIVACVADQHCVRQTGGDDARSHAAYTALVTGGLGLVAGIFLTKNVDRVSPPVTNPARASQPLTLGLLPGRDARGELMPLMSAAGFF